jgi:hypothetical protein
MCWTGLKQVCMCNKYVRKYSTFLAIQETQINVTLKFQLIPGQMAVTKKIQNTKCGRM